MRHATRRVLHPERVPIEYLRRTLFLELELNRLASLIGTPQAKHAARRPKKKIAKRASRQSMNTERT